MSRTFIEPSDEGLFRMYEDMFSMQEGLSELALFLNERAALPPAEREEHDNGVLRTYTRLFCMSDSIKVTESANTSSSGLNKQGAYEAVLKEYQRYNIGQKDMYNEDEDHIAHELGFMAWLCGMARAKEQQEEILPILKDQYRFINEHINNWFPMFNSAIQKWECESRFYKLVSAFMIDFIREDCEFLEEVIG